MEDEKLHFSWRADAFGGKHLFVSGFNTAFSINEVDGAWAVLSPSRRILATGFTVHEDAERWLQAFYRNNSDKAMV